jgi:hypothetical protein
MNMQKCCMEGKNKLQKHKKLLKRIIKEIWKSIKSYWKNKTTNMLILKVDSKESKMINQICRI